VGGPRRPQTTYRFRLWAERLWAFAGLRERWQGPVGPVESCAILTTEANELVRPVHERMPVILPQQHWPAWLDAGLQGAGELVPLLRPYPSDAMRTYPVGLLVNNPRNDGPGCLAPAQGSAKP
jgi:putative SOS response-associated peptidase YedK